MLNLPRSGLPVLLALLLLLAPAGVRPIELDAPTEIDLPDIGESTSAALSPRDERRIGEGLVVQIRRSGLMVEDSLMEDYLEQLGLRIVAQSGATEDFSFFWLADPRINAFAAPGGVVGVNTGLLLNARNESELASVLAHEVSHVTQRHTARSIEAQNRLSVPMAVALVGAILASIANPEIGQAALAAANAGGQQYAINFTRANEQEADRIGMQVLARAGFEPRAMADFFDRLQTANRYNDPKQIPEYLRTHPVTVNRIAEARSLSERYPQARLPAERDFHLARARVQVYTAERTEEILNYFEESLRTGKFADEAAARYGYALALMRSGEFDLAQVQMERLARAQPDRPEFGLGLVEIERKKGKLDAAYQRTLALAKAFPNHRPVVVAEAEMALETKHDAEARTLLRAYPYKYRVDLRYYRLLAQAEGRGGSQVESHIALAEYYRRLGDLPLALEQLKLARDSRGVDTYQRSRIEARSHEFEIELAEQEERGR
jgi:beta-barrel assembly-enhancing protease